MVDRPFSDTGERVEQRVVRLPIRIERREVVQAVASAAPAPISAKLPAPQPAAPSVVALAPAASAPVSRYRATKPPNAGVTHVASGAIDTSHDADFTNAIAQMRSRSDPLSVPAASADPSATPFHVAFGPAVKAAFGSRLSAANWPLPQSGLFAHAKIVRTEHEAVAVRSMVKLGRFWFCIGYYANVPTANPQSALAGPYAGPCHTSWLEQLGVAPAASASPSPTAAEPSPATSELPGG
jgi:hypothetical protein